MNNDTYDTIETDILVKHSKWLYNYLYVIIDSFILNRTFSQGILVSQKIK